MTDRPGTVRWRDRLPRGQTLPPATWARRHRAMTWIAWAHVPALIVFALATGHAFFNSVLDVTPIARLPRSGRRAGAEPPVSRRRRLLLAADVLGDARLLLGRQDRGALPL